MHGTQKLHVVTIETARPRDLEAIQALLAAVDAPTDVPPDLADFLVARLDGRLVGCIGMEVHGEDALFRSFAVSADQRRAGVGTRLYSVLVRLARGRGVRQAFLMTRSIEALAASWGFRTLPREEAPDDIRASPQIQGNSCTRSVLMRIDLLESTMDGASAAAGGA